MVNIIDCFRNVVTDRYAFVKIFIMAIPIFVAVFATISGQTAVAGIVEIVFGIVFVAIFFETIRRSCNADQHLLPTFIFPVRMFVTLCMTVISAIPVLIVCGGILFGYFTLITTYPEMFEDKIVAYILSFIFGILTMSIFFASVTQFLDTGKIFDAYNPMKTLRALKTFIVNLIFFIIQDILLVGVVVVIPLLVIYLLGGNNQENVFVILYACMGFVMNYLVFADYIGQTKKDSESPYERLM